MRPKRDPGPRQLAMRMSLLAAALTCASVCACSKLPLEVRPSPFPGLTLSIDESPAWSHDGRTIAFHRRIPSSAGPAGVYLTTPYGGEPRFLATGSLFFPNDLTFSPDDRYLAGVDGYQLWICEVATGQVSRPMYTGEGMFKPDWSPDGKKIVYSRLPLPNNPDSGGIRILDLESSTDVALKFNGRIVYTDGDQPLWTRDGKWIACTESYGIEPERFSLIRPDGSERRDIISTRGGWERPRRYYRPAHGRDGFLFSQHIAGVPESGAFYVNADGSGLVNTFNRSVLMKAFSPDGSEYVGAGVDPSDTNFVLFVIQTDDVTETSRRQITWYEPPGGQTATPAAALRERGSSAPVPLAAPRSRPPRQSRPRRTRRIGHRGG